MAQEDMPDLDHSTPVFRFAPSPNGLLHLGHALSALLNAEGAKATGGRLLLRIEDIDIGRCTPEFENSIYDDLAWLGLDWEKPVRRQSEHSDAYRAALDRLDTLGLIYPAFLSRAEIKAYAKNNSTWPQDPDGAPHYPTFERDLDPAEARQRIEDGARHSLRLNMEKALSLLSEPLTWTEGDENTIITADPAAWGDVILWRWDAPSSYHLSVVVDDALQGVTHVVRGRDLYHATSVHRLLQSLLGLPAPHYHHHRLILGEDGRKLSKSEGAASIQGLRQQGLSAFDIRKLLDLKHLSFQAART
ncbi:tRNA glutamyl-Q(34) synthetase GluQRS [Rhizobium sp.]|jgi:glutamyl-Q tRNA(Asp) synthetase|uniref:tRNA glutamyl-Q(34) synthetase GluQRS n=1 Tax=Rhizobium sp. TaxID=391 RepID=UPI000E8333C2|nr:tRNA glutamyl-Q(34) synthetase GluQRS [Rhizobium sp.]